MPAARVRRVKAGREPRGYLAQSERDRIVAELQRVLVAGEVVREHLEVAAAREHVDRSEWSVRQLDALCEAARALEGAVLKSPVVDA